VFERRLAPSYAAAEDYLKLFAPSAFMNSVGRVLVFLSGSLGAVCLALAGLNDAILLHVKIGNWNLLWYAGLLGVVFSGGKGLLPDESVIPQYHHDLFSDIDTALVKVSSHTHYYPEFWKKRGWDEKVKKIFSRMFMTKFNLFLMEVASIIVAPIILCSSLPSRAVDICTFVQKTKAEISGTGDHCGFATFDFDSFGDENWEGQQEESQRIRSEPTTVDALDATRSAVYAQMNSTRCPKTKMGKTEKSFFNFKTIHPAWKCTSSWQDLVDKVDSYRSEQEKALSYERQHHIAAAARQLDTLLHLEQKGEEMKKDAVIGRINEHYVNAEDTEKQEIFSNQIDNGKHDKNDLKVHFKDQASQLPSMSPISASRTTSKSNLSVLASVLQYDDLGLSAELNGLLDRSTLDPGASLMVPGSFGQSLPSLSFLGKTQISHHGDEESKKEHLLQRQVSCILSISTITFFPRLYLILTQLFSLIMKYMLLERYHSQARS
jgi:autophagy-related protein 9